VRLIFLKPMGAKSVLLAYAILASLFALIAVLPFLLVRFL
jgi:hypothetical protein